MSYFAFALYVTVSVITILKYIGQSDIAPVTHKVATILTRTTTFIKAKPKKSDDKHWNLSASSGKSRKSK